MQGEQRKNEKNQCAESALIQDRVKAENAASLRAAISALRFPTFALTVAGPSTNESPA